MATVNLSWNDNADNEDGYRVYRGTTSGSLTQIADLPANTTSYSDSGVSRGDTYYYQVEGYTEHSASTSLEESIYVPHDFTRSATGHVGTLAGMGTRSAMSYTRSVAGYIATLQGSANVTLQILRSVTGHLSPTGGSSSRTATYNRTPTGHVTALDGSASISLQVARTGHVAALGGSASRETHYERRSEIYGSAGVDASNEGITKPRSTELWSQKFDLDSRAEFMEVFPEQSSTDLDFTLITSPVIGFASEWVREDHDILEPEAFTVVLDVDVDVEFEIRVQYDATGDGNADVTEGPRAVIRNEQVHSFDHLGDAGWYRLIVSNLRPDTELRAVMWGPTRY